jgi:hypothetical protein
MDHHTLKELLPLAALDRLEGDERLALDDHLADGCSGCASELRAFKESLVAFALVAADQSPDARIWNRLELRLPAASDRADAPGQADGRRSAAFRVGSSADAGGGRRQPGRGAVSRPWQIVAGIATAVAAAVVVFALQQSVQLTTSTSQFRRQIAKLNGRISEMTTDLAAADGRVASLSSELENRVRLTHILLSPEGLRVELEGSTFLTRVLLAPDANVVKMRPLRRAGGATGLITISSRAGTAILETSGLPPNPPDAVYELWWIVARRTPIRAAVFGAQGEGDAIVLASLPPRGVPLVASAVTLEPASGGELPRGAMYLKGEVTP